MKWYNQIMIWGLRSPLQRFITGLMLIEFAGRKSGNRLRVPVSYVREADYLYTVSFRRRTWWRNLRGGAPVTVRIQGGDVPAVAEALTQPQAVIEGLKTMLRLSPAHARWYHVSFDSRGQPNPDEVARAAESRVIVRTRLQH